LGREALKLARNELAADVAESLEQVLDS
jgi:hypothetical protein